MYISAPTIPLASMAMSFDLVRSSHPLRSNLRVRCVMAQKRNRIHVALSRALIVLTILATCDGSLAKWEKRLAVSMKNGAPGG